MRNIIRARQSGFTLVEIAIVLVIIGLLLVGVLQGQEMIENTKVKSVVSDMKSIQAAYNGYMDRYKAIPGDESTATMLARGWPGTGGAVAGPATPNGFLLAAPGAATFAAGAATEHEGFWRGLRASGLLTGDPTLVAAASNPTHAMGGRFGMASNGGAAVPTVFGLSGVFICANGLTTKQASAIDVLIDGPLPATQIGNNIGNLRASTAAVAAAAPAGLAYNETATVANWNVCMRIG